MRVVALANLVRHKESFMELSMGFQAFDESNEWSYSQSFFHQKLQRQLDALGDWYL